MASLSCFTTISIPSCEGCFSSFLLVEEEDEDSWVLSLEELELGEIWDV